jgi:flagellum-specific peptidoglycan hydrolase FlgJ
VPPDILAYALRSHALYPVVPVSVTLAQWAKESGWNQFMPPNSNNPFGIKCYDPDKGCSAAKTAEQDSKGKQSILTQKFQTFASMDEAFVSHARLLATLSVYDRARNASDIDGFARGLKPYATDIDYTASLIRDYLRPYDLYKYDECENAIAAW